MPPYWPNPHCSRGVKSPCFLIFANLNSEKGVKAGNYRGNSPLGASAARHYIKKKYGRECTGQYEIGFAKFRMEGLGFDLDVSFAFTVFFTFHPHFRAFMSFLCIKYYLFVNISTHHLTVLTYGTILYAYQERRPRKTSKRHKRHREMEE